MPLNLSVGDGDFTPYLKYNAKAGRFYAKPEGGAEEIEISSPVLAFDMANIRTGWLYYSEGAGPEKVWDPSPAQTAPRPPGPQKWKRGFEVMVFGTLQMPGGKRLGLREFSSTAGNVIVAILRMHSEYEAGMNANRGKVPFFTCKNVKAVQGMYGTNYEPMFELTGWVERSKVSAFDEHIGEHNDHVPSVQNGRSAAPLQHVVTEKKGYTLSEMRKPDPIEEATGHMTRDPDDEQVPF